MRRWSRPLNPPAVLKDGMTIQTLSEAMQYILTLPFDKKNEDMWKHTVALLKRAAQTSAASDIDDASDQFGLALAFDGVAILP